MIKPNVLENEIPVLDIRGDVGAEIYNSLSTIGCVIITGSYPNATLNELFKTNTQNNNLCDLHIEFMRTLADKFVKLVGIENLDKESTMSNMVVMETPNDFTNRFVINPGFFTFTAVDKQCFEILVDNSIITVPYVPNSFVVTVGDALSRATNYVFNAVAHRINPDAHAMSIPFFYDPSADFYRP